MKLLYLLAACYDCGKTCRRLQGTIPLCPDCREARDGHENPGAELFGDEDPEPYPTPGELP